MPADPRLGTVIAGYRVEQQLGRGGMSVVYKAEHIELGRKVALKVLLPELAEDDAFRDRFVRESRLAAGLDHPNIVPIYEAGDADGILYIAMRLVVGTDLAELISASGALDPLRVLGIARQTANALDAAHDNGLVHRDVKPANILIVTTGGTQPADHVYLTDFGVTKRVGASSQATAVGHLVGTLQYVAPEQIEGAEVDRRADVYSLGCVLYEALTGRRPFERDSEVAVLWAHMREPPPSLLAARPALPRKLDAVIAKAMAKSPDDRFATADELATAFADVLVGPRTALPRPEDDPDEDTAAAPDRAEDGLRGRWIALGAAVVAAVAVAAFALGRSDEPPGARVPVDSLVRIDPASGEIVGSTPVGRRPTDVAFGEGSVWVANFADSTITRADPATGRKLATFTGLRNMDGLVTGFRSVWVVAPEGTLARFDARDGTFRESAGLNVGLTDVAVHGDSLWISNEVDNLLKRVDPDSLEVSAALGYGDRAVASGEDAVWAVDAADSTVYEIDPDGNLVVEDYGLVEPPAAVAAGEGAVWVAQPANDQVTRIDPGVGLTARIDVGDGPVAVAAGGGWVWVSNSLDGTVSKIDPVRNEVVQTIEIGNSPDGIAVGGGLVWVAVRGA